jgi:homoserine dehydrogenase
VADLTIDLALIGFGHVGRRFVRLLEERQAWLAGRYGFSPRVVAIATGRHGHTISPTGLDALRAADDIEQGRDFDSCERRVKPADSERIIRAAAAARPTGRPFVVVETTPLDIATGRPAVDHVRAALEAGAHVITANKGPAAFAYRELTELADSLGLLFRFESAVMDGIPLFNMARETLKAVRVNGFRGVVNSTTNHILSAMDKGEAYDAALAEMQTAGIAETDPSLDVDGWDAAAKTAALANVLLDAGITPHDVTRRGIAAITSADIRSARDRGRRVKLVASGARTAGGVTTKVAPEELPTEDHLARLDGMANALEISTDLLGTIVVTQLEGGLTQTAYGLLSDLIEVAGRIK